MRNTFISKMKVCFYKFSITASKLPQAKKSSCAKKETVDIDIPKTSRNNDKKSIEPIRTMSGASRRIRKWNQFN